MDIKINQSVAILCDGNNIERSIQENRSRNTMLNFDTVIPKLLNGRGLNRLIYFREGKHISDKFAERLYENYYGSVVPCHKSADIPLSIKATQLASKVDTIIIMSGDSDYVDLVSHLKSEGVRVEIAAVKETTAHILIRAADYFHPITNKDWYTYAGKKYVKKPYVKRPNTTAPQVNKPAQNRAPVKKQEVRKPPVVKTEIAKPAEVKPVEKKAPEKKGLKSIFKKLTKKSD